MIIRKDDRDWGMLAFDFDFDLVLVFFVVV